MARVVFAIAPALLHLWHHTADARNGAEPKLAASIGPALQPRNCGDQSLAMAVNGLLPGTRVRHGYTEQPLPGCAGFSCLTLPPENVSLAEWFNSDKENENDKDIKGQVH
ncbi:hypothetical protein RCH06_003583, partial [Polaromonas sp. CG_9.5]|uniref:hypothetical protein n=1 Tax=Polaromonas sp. CG_9.5 TaxID=3071705 RepID=UPI002E07A6FA|nr:hypothetical protein [Polaromonas sp. CG_9.5]